MKLEHEAPTAADQCARLLSPRGVTVVGASENAAPSRHLMENLLGGPARSTYPGAVTLVNRSRPVLYGRQALASTDEVEGGPGLVFLLIGSRHCLDALRGFAELPDGVVVYSSGAESGFADVEADLRAWSLEHEVPLLGPQATGIVRPADRLTALTAPLRADPVPGSTAIVMQSAGLLGGTVNALSQRGVGIHTAVSIGNAAVIGYGPLAAHLIEDDDVRAVAMYVDTLASMDELIAVARRAQELEKPIVLCVGGRSDAGSVAVQSHTGALATSHRTLKGVADQFGIVLVADTDELVWAVETFEQMEFRRPPSGGVGIFSTSGGGAIMLADALDAGGAPLPLPGDATRAELGKDRKVVTWNPFDSGAAALDDPSAVDRALEVFAGDPAFSVIVSCATVGIPTQEGMGVYVRQTDAFVATVRELGKQPLIASPVAGAPGVAGPELARWDGVPVGQGAKEAAVKARVICDWAVRPDVGEATNMPAGPSYPEGAPLTVISGVDAERELADLAAHWPAAHAVSAAADVTAALAGLRLPVVAKAEAGLAHRAASGGVLRGLADPRAVTLAVELLLERFGGKVELVEEVPHDAELTLGFQRDARNGPLLMFGLGGAAVGDAVEFRVLPLSDGQIDALLGRYLDSTAERAAVSELIRTFQVHVLAHPEVASVDLNPFVLRDDDVVLLDAKIHVASGG